MSTVVGYRLLIDSNRLLKSMAIAVAWMVISSPLAQANVDQHRSASGIQIAAKDPGVILSVQAEKPAEAVTHAGQRYLITYRSRGAHGEPIVASGYVLLPKGQPPAGGWPVLAWAHGTTGIADTCAPSEDYPGGPVHGYQEIVDEALNPWLARGYAVVAPDYQGLGTPGGHPYMNAASQLHTVIDAVRAAHQLRPGQFSPDWLVMGHSQGGAAALEVAANGQKDAPQLNLRGAVAIAPGGYDYAGIAEYALKHPNPAPGVAAFFPIVLLGASAADPSIHPDALVTAQMRPLLDQARSRCLSELRTGIEHSPEHVFKKDADLKPLLAYLKQQAIENMSPTVPVLLIQGSADQLVDPRGTQAYYQQLCRADKSVTYRTIAQGSHRDALRRSPELTDQFLASLNDGKQPASCSASHHQASHESPPDKK